MRLDGAVRGRVRNASQHKAVTGLVVVQEGLVGLVDGTRDNLTRARRARARSAGVRQVNASFFSRVENVGVVRAFNLLGAFRGFQSDREVHDGHASLHFLLVFLRIIEGEGSFNFLRPTHLGLNPNRRRRRLSLVVLTSGDKQGRNTTTIRGGSKFVSSRARAKRNARNYSLEMSITRLLFAICGVSRGASALWSHTARAKNAHHRRRSEREKAESNRGKERNPSSKKKGKIQERKSARAKLRKESSKR